MMEALKKWNASTLEFPLKEKATLTGTISYPANTESEPNKRTIFKRLQEKTNVEIDWTAIQADQWSDKFLWKWQIQKYDRFYLFSGIHDV